MKLTQTVVDKAGAAGKDLFLWDSDLPGFGVRIKPSGVRSYIIQYRNKDGQSKRVTLGRHGVLTAGEARALARRRLVDLAFGRDPARRLPKGIAAVTVGALCERYLKEHAEPNKKPASVREDRRLIDTRIGPALGDRLIEAVARGDVVALHQSMAKTPYEANRTLALLSKMFNLAEDWGLREAGSNPCRRIGRFPEKPRERTMTAAELARFGAVLAEAESTHKEDPSLLAGLRLLLYTGCRVSELLSFRWDDIDWSARTVHLPDSPTGPKSIVLGKAAMDVLATLPYLSEYALPAIRTPEAPLSAATLEHVWRRCRDRAGLEGVRLNDLRYTFAAWAAMEGYGASVRNALVGDGRSQPGRPAPELAPRVLLKAANTISQRLAAALSQKKSAKKARARRTRR